MSKFNISGNDITDETKRKIILSQVLNIFLKIFKRRYQHFLGRAKQLIVKIKVKTFPCISKLNILYLMIFFTFYPILDIFSFQSIVYFLYHISSKNKKKKSFLKEKISHKKQFITQHESKR